MDSVISVTIQYVSGTKKRPLPIIDKGIRKIENEKVHNRSVQSSDEKSND